MSVLPLISTWVKDAIANAATKRQLVYIVEAAQWSVNWDGRYLSEAVARQRLLTARISTTPVWLRNTIIHFGSFRTMYWRQSLYSRHPSNRYVLTVFHIQPGNRQYEVLKDIAKGVSFVHTSATASRQDLKKLGVPPEKIRVIPLGVDTNLFKPVNADNVAAIRKRLGIDPNKLVVGSFQKDGVGWGAGAEPKLEKGPDTFLAAVKELAQNYPVHVLLVGPARGYVTRGLQENKVPYTSLGFLPDFADVARYYAALDVYIIASRVEGGPKALLEGWASGIPVVSTRMGMAADIAEAGTDTLLAEVGDSTVLARQAARIFDEPLLRQNLIANGLSKVQNYTWNRIAQRYYEEMYKQLL